MLSRSFHRRILENTHSFVSYTLFCSTWQKRSVIWHRICSSSLTGMPVILKKIQQKLKENENNSKCWTKNARYIDGDCQHKKSPHLHVVAKQYRLVSLVILRLKGLQIDYKLNQHNMQRIRFVEFPKSINHFSAGHTHHWTATWNMV